MSWIWNSPPPEEEPANPSSTNFPDYISPDPYSSHTYESNTQDPFGTAFSDDIDTTTTTPSDSFTPSFTTEPLPSDPFPSDSLSPPSSVDFNSMGRINPSILSPRTLQTSPSVDYVFADDYKEVRKKSGAEQLTYLAGTSYLSGAILGGSRGFYQALQASSGKTAKLRLNAILNATGKQGSALANTFGVLALAFSLSESALYNYTNDETLGNYALAGATAGALFKSTRGPRTVALWAVGGAVTALGTVYASRQGYYGRGLQGIL